MRSSTTWSHAVVRGSDLQGSLLLANAALLLIGAWITLGFAPAAPGGIDARAERHPLALEAYAEACSQGDRVACNNLGVCYGNGYGTQRDDETALAIFERACRAGSADACNNQAAVLERGPEGANARATLHDLYRRACAGGAGIGCSNLGALYAARTRAAGGAELEYARSLFARACQLGSVVGCENQAALAARAAPRPPGEPTPGTGFEG